MDRNAQYLLMSRWKLLKLACSGDRIAKCCLRICQSLDWDESDHPRGERGRFETKGGSSTSVNKKQSPTNVTSEYQKTAKPGKGAVTMQAGYMTKGHQSEITTAYWLRDTLGGDVELIAESHVSGEKTPDMRWRGQNWEVKDISSAVAADAAIRKALKQINGSGGIILRCPSSGISISDIRKHIEGRMRHMKEGIVDVMIIQNGKLIEVSNHKK